MRTRWSMRFWLITKAYRIVSLRNQCGEWRAPFELWKSLWRDTANFPSEVRQLLARAAPTCTLYAYSITTDAYTMRPWPRLQIGAQEVLEAA